MLPRAREHATYSLYGTTVEGLPVPDGSEASSGRSHHNADILKVVEPFTDAPVME